jgi:hypothetical protein
VLRAKLEELLRQLAERSSRPGANYAAGRAGTDARRGRGNRRARSRLTRDVRMYVLQAPTAKSATAIPLRHYGGPAGWESKLVGTPA